MFQVLSVSGDDRTGAKEQYNHRTKGTEGSREICACMVRKTIRRIKFYSKRDTRVTKLAIVDRSYMWYGCSCKITIHRVYQELVYRNEITFKQTRAPLPLLLSGLVSLEVYNRIKKSKFAFYTL